MDYRKIVLGLLFVLCAIIWFNNRSEIAIVGMMIYSVGYLIIEKRDSN